MNLNNLAVNGLSSLLDITIVTIFYRRWLEHRNNKYIRFLLPIIFCIIMTLLTTAANMSAIVPVVVFFLFLSYAMTFAGKTSSRLFTALIVFGIMILSELLSGVLLMQIHQGDLSYIHDNIIFYMQGIALSKIITFTICKIIGFFKERDISVLNAKIIICLIIITSSSITSIYYIAMYVYNTAGIINGIPALILTILIIFAFISTFWVFNNIIKTQKEKMRTVFEKRQYQNQIENFKY